MKGWFFMSIFDDFFKRLGTTIEWSVIDDLVMSDANILRPVVGHAFEILFDEVITKKLHGTIIDQGGDTDIDRIVIDLSNNRHTLQIKTPINATINKGVSFQVNLHKTHGQEKRPQNLYPTHWPCTVCGPNGHDGDEFPEFLVVQHPENGVVIVPKSEIPENKKYPGHFADPVTFDWNNKWLNRWDLLGFPAFKGMFLDRRSVPKQKFLPKIANRVALTDQEIVSMWMKPENFRMIDMNLKGNLREPAFTKMLSKLGVIVDKPKHAYPKYDRITTGGIRIQIKGTSKSMTDYEQRKIGSEVMGTHGKGAIRCYSETDFDYFAMVIDPGILPNSGGIKSNEYHFCLIPVKALPLHYKNKTWATTNKIYPNCKFKISEHKGKLCLIPDNNYRIDVTYRENGPWYIDTLPKNFS